LINKGKALTSKSSGRLRNGKPFGKLPLGDIKTQGWGIPTGIEMRNKTSRIPDEVLKEIFPRKFNRSLACERVYSQLKQMILSGKIKKGQRLLREEIAQSLNVSETVVSKAFSQLKKDGLVIIKGRVGSFVA
jgi:hypothetical protein